MNYISYNFWNLKTKILMWLWQYTLQRNKTTMTTQIWVKKTVLIHFLGFFFNRYLKYKGIQSILMHQNLMKYIVVFPKWHLPVNHVFKQIKTDWLHSKKCYYHTGEKQNIFLSFPAVINDIISTSFLWIIVLRIFI